jgi:hypothetical protein
MRQNFDVEVKLDLSNKNEFDEKLIIFESKFRIVFDLILS